MTVKVELFGNRNRQVEVNAPQQPAPVVEVDGKRHHQKASFAAMTGLVNGLRQYQLATGEVWSYIKAKYKVESRADFSEVEYAVIAARLRAARRDAGQLRQLVNAVRAYQKSQQQPEPQTVSPATTAKLKRQHYDAMPF